MRTHFLNQLSIMGRESVLALEPSFDFYRAKRILNLSIDFDPTADDELPSLRLVAEYVGNTRRYTLTILLESVRELLLPEMNPLLFLPELEIEDLKDRMMEGIRFEVISQFERRFGGRYLVTRARRRTLRLKQRSFRSSPNQCCHSSTSFKQSLKSLSF